MMLTEILFKVNEENLPLSPIRGTMWLNINARQGFQRRNMLPYFLRLIKKTVMPYYIPYRKIVALGVHTTRKGIVLL